MSEPQNYIFCVKISKIRMLFFTYFPNVRTNFCYYIYWLRFKMIPRISILFGSRGEATDILTMIGMQKCNFSGKSENWTYVYACCTCKWITNNEWLVCIYILDFPLNIYVTKIGQLHISKFFNSNSDLIVYEFIRQFIASNWMKCIWNLFKDKSLKWTKLFINWLLGKNAFYPLQQLSLP